jgi:phosphoesterase RecJ-like protein
LNTGKQFTEAINQANHALVTFRKEWSPDAVGSAITLARFLKAKGKQVDVVADGFQAPESLKFLPDMETIRPGLEKLQKYVISLNVAQTGIDELSYDLAGDQLKIFITPKTGQFGQTDLTAQADEFKYDLIITVDTPDYAALGRVFSDHSDFFYQRPVINIDHDPANERFGNLNIVDIAAASASEVLHQLLTEIKETAWDEDTATCLLTGLIAKTRSFKTAKVTPRTLQIASELIAAGGRRDQIVQHLYRTRTLPTLKLWGRALARVKHDPVTRFAWTLLVKQDFIAAGTDESELPGVMEELLMNSPEAEICGVIYESQAKPATGQPAGICALICSDKHDDATRLVANLRPDGDHRLARLCFPTHNLIEAEKSVLNAIYSSLGKTAPYGQEAESTPAIPELGHPELVPVRAARNGKAAKTEGGQPDESAPAKP